VIVVTQVIDQRDSTNVNTRYLTRQLQSNQNIQEQAFVVINEVQTMTIGNSQASDQNPPVSGQVQQYATYDSTAPAQLVLNSTQQAVASNSTGGAIFGQQILPAGATAPTWSNAQLSVDPAVILEANPKQAAFVSFVEDEETQSETTIITSSGSEAIVLITSS